MKKYKMTEVDKILEDLLIGKALENVSKKDDNIRLSFDDFTLKISAHFRFTLGSEIILVKQDIFMPSYGESNKENFNWDLFDANKNETRFNEQVKRFFNEDVIDNYVVKDVRAGKFGDFVLFFKNGATLEVVSDSSYDQPMWSIDDSLMVTPYGVEMKGEQNDY